MDKKWVIISVFEVPYGWYVVERVDGGSLVGGVWALMLD